MAQTPNHAGKQKIIEWPEIGDELVKLSSELSQMSDKNSHPTMSDYAFSTRPSPPVANFPLRTACAHAAECADLNFVAATCSQIISFTGAPS
jgi:hypothetical protein